MSDLKIEILGPEHWQEYRDIRLRALRADPTAFGESYGRELRNSSQESIVAKLSEPHRKVYAGKCGSKIVALAVYTLVLPEHVEHNAAIHAVFVDPDYRGQGIGYTLMKQVIEDLHKTPKISRLVLSVNEKQESAVRMYQKLGFKKFGIGKKEMKIGDTYYDQVQMELIFEDKL